MGIFGDIGRSNLTRDAQSVFGDVMRYRQMDRQDDRDAMAGMAQVQQMELQKKNAAIAEAQEKRSQAEFDAKERERNRRLPLTLRWGPMDTWSNSRKAIVDEGRKMGLVEDVGGVPTASPNDYKTFIESLAPDKGLEFSAMSLSEHAADMGEIQRKLAAKPDDEKLLAEKDRIVGLYTKAKESHDTLVGALAAKKKAEGEGRVDALERRIESNEKIAGIRADSAAEVARIRSEASVDRAAAGGETKEEKRKVKAFTEVRKEVEKAYGFSQFLPSAQDPKLLQKVARGKEVAEDIIDNYRNYGLSAEPKPGKAAHMAKIKVDEEFKAKPVAPAEDKKSKSIRELLFGSSEKK